MRETDLPRTQELDDTALDGLTRDFEQVRKNLIEGLKQLSLPDLIRVMRRDEGDSLGELSRSAGAFGELAAVHFDLDKPAEAFNFMLTMGLRFVEDKDLDTEASKAQEWVVREHGYIFTKTDS
jgi:hypothetical protein